MSAINEVRLVGATGTGPSVPLLFQSVFQHLDSSDQIALQVLLAFPLPLQERYPGLEKNTRRRITNPSSTVRLDTEKCSTTSPLKGSDAE